MIPIRLNTAYGADQFQILNDQFIHYTKYGMRDDFKLRCQEDLLNEDAYLMEFLDNEQLARQYKMNEDDPIGMELYREHSDIYSALKYFVEKAY